MKKIALLTILLLSIFSAKAQNQNLEKNVLGLQVGLFGLDIYNESRLSENIALRSEVSFFPEMWGGDLYEKTGFAVIPALTIQPKYYYNIQKRAEKGKNIKNNSANYFGLQLRYLPDLFVISNSDYRVSNQIHVIPTFGIRRNFSKNFNYEFKTGVGYGSTFGYDKNDSGVVIDLSFKVGFDF